MVATLEIPQSQTTIAGPTRRTWLTAVLALAASAGMLLWATPHSVSPLAYWAVSSLALATVLSVLVVGEHAWDQMLVNARAAGVVGR